MREAVTTLADGRILSHPDVGTPADVAGAVIRRCGKE